MNLPINKQTILITGAGRGLGSDIARSFYNEGAKVIINYRKSFESAKKLSTSLGERAFLVQGDIRNKNDVAKIKDELKKQNITVDTIIHNAIDDYVFNGDQRKKIDEIEWNDFEKQIQTTQRGFLNLVNVFAPDMKKKTFWKNCNYWNKFIPKSSCSLS